MSTYMYMYNVHACKHGCFCYWFQIQAYGFRTNICALITVHIVIQSFYLHNHARNIPLHPTAKQWSPTQQPLLGILFLVLRNLFSLVREEEFDNSKADLGSVWNVLPGGKNLGSIWGLVLRAFVVDRRRPPREVGGCFGVIFVFPNYYSSV